MRLFFLLFLVSWNYSISQTQSHLFDISRVIEIDKKSINTSSKDILHLFSKDELPDIFRLGGILLKPFYIDEKLVKYELTYNGDRETIIETYYLDSQNEVFFIKYHYQFFEPPKWEEGSTVVLEEKSNSFIYNNV